jgi:small redox-active disulfide protein 2
MKVKVLGTGCFTCKALYEQVEEVIAELGINAELEKVEDLTKIIEYGIMSVPALVINDEVKFFGKLPSKEELKKYFILS